jgi:hypothetical protein
MLVHSHVPRVRSLSCIMFVHSNVLCPFTLMCQVHPLMCRFHSLSCAKQKQAHNATNRKDRIESYNWLPNTIIQKNSKFMPQHKPTTVRKIRYFLLQNSVEHIPNYLTNLVSHVEINASKNCAVIPYIKNSTRNTSVRS